MSINVLHNRSTTVNENDGLPLPKRYWAILATALGVGMSVIDGTIANQGFGAAAITSVNTALLRIIYPKRFLGRGMGINCT